MSERTSYSISELGEAAGVSRRTVRFYVQRGLLPPPEGLGRSACYTNAHLARLLQIKAWQEQGVPLEVIRVRLLREEVERAPASAGIRERTWYAQPHGARDFTHAPGTAWFRQPLIAGVELHVGGGRSPLTAHQLAALAAELARILEREEKEKEEEEKD